MAVREITHEDFASWVAMRARLWPDEHDLVSETADVRWGRLGVFVWEEAGGLVGFAEVSIRSVVDGAASSPVGFLEGWWVDEAHRRKGIGRALVAAGEAWAADRGAVEIGSDSDSGNLLGEAAHRSVGFVPQGTVMQWLKPIARPDAAERLPEPGDDLVLVQIDRDNVRPVATLAVAPHQRGFVAPNAVSIAEASVSEHAWLRAIYAGDVPVGLVLMWEDADQPMYYLWRFMIDARYQGRGFGKRAMELVIEHVRALPGATRLHLSYVPLAGGPGDFYRRLGFVDTGKIEDGEVEAVLELRPPG